MDATSRERSSSRNKLRALLPFLMNLWIAFVLVTFFLIRILGSSSGQRVLARLGIHYAG